MATYKFCPDCNTYGYKQHKNQTTGKYSWYCKECGRDTANISTIKRSYNSLEDKK